MPRRGAAALLLTTAALALLLSFKTPSDATPTAGNRVVVSGAATPTPAPAAARPSATIAPAATSPAATTAPVSADLRDGTIDGAAIDTRWGTVQVQVTIAGGAITDVAALQLPSGDHPPRTSASGLSRSCGARRSRCRVRRSTSSPAPRTRASPTRSRCRPPSTRRGPDAWASASSG